MAIEAIESISALSRITEIQQRMNELEKKFTYGTSGSSFQKTLEDEMEKLNSTENIKPIEQFLAENKIEPVQETVSTGVKRVAAAPKATTISDTADATISDSVEIFEPPMTDELLESDDNISYTSTEDMIKNAAAHYGVDPDLVKAVATAESNLNQNARSYVGAIGVMQLMPETAANLGVDPYDEQQNIEGGAHYLRQMIDKFNGNIKHAIAAYNAGPGAVQKYGGIPPYSETQNYVGRVLDFYVR